MSETGSPAVMRSLGLLYGSLAAVSVHLLHSED